MAATAREEGRVPTMRHEAIFSICVYCTIALISLSPRIPANGQIQVLDLLRHIAGRVLALVWLGGMCDSFRPAARLRQDVQVMPLKGSRIEKDGELRVSGKWPVVHSLGIIFRKTPKGRSSMYFWPRPLHPFPDLMQIAIAVSKHSLTVTARQQSCNHRAIRSLSSYFKSKVSAVST